MKQYLLFAGDHYYPLGGWDDYRGDFDTIEEAKNAVQSYHDWWMVVDKETGGVVERD